MNCIARHRRLRGAVTSLTKRWTGTNYQMWSKRYPLGPLDNVDQRGNHLYRLLDRLDRHVTMRVWQETCKVADELNKQSPLERRELPVVFVRRKQYTPTHKVEYPPRNIPPVIEPGCLMWWSIDDVFEQVINPGYGLFATAENVAEYGGVDVGDMAAGDADEGAAKDMQFYCEPELVKLLQSSSLVSSSPVSRDDVVEYLRTELNLFVASENTVVLHETLSTPGVYMVPLKVNSEISESLKVVVSG